MITIKKLLIPTDFSENASKAYNITQKFASHLGAKIDFIHVIQTLTHYNKGLAKLHVPLKTDEDLYPQLKKQAMHQLEKLMRENIRPENAGAAVISIAEYPYRAITHQASQGKYDLIIMATQGEHDSNFLIGSVAEKVIRYSSVPVLSTRTAHMDDIGAILVPTDGSPNSFKALLVAVSLAQTFGASITLLNVQLTSAKSLSHGSSYDPDITDVKGALTAELKDALKNLFKGIDYHLEDGESDLRLRIKKKDITLNIDVKRGGSAHKVITDAAQNYADLVVMATHGYTGFNHLVLGSTAENVVRHAPLPVITVKPDFAG